MKQINDKLAKLKAEIKEKDRLSSILSKVIRQKNKVEEDKRIIHNQLIKEKIDVEKLEGLSLSGFLHAITGRKLEKLEKEKEEYLAVKLKYDAVTAELESLLDEIRDIKARIDQIGDPAAEYDILIKEKERIISNTSSSLTNKLDRIIEQESRLVSDNKEIDEAIKAGEALSYALGRVQDSLRSAGNWGTWDILGGGMVSTLIKHSRIDDAQREINNARSLINRFHRELQDIGENMILNIEIGSFLTFADYLFDGLFVDLAVQSKIREAQNKVDITRNKVSIVLMDLRERLDSNNRKLLDLRNERMRIIEEA
jgi:hypothetical protein